MQVRKSERTISKRRAGLVINLDSNPERVPCFLLDSSIEGFRVGGIFRVRCGQVVELLLEEGSSNSVQCKVIWVGKVGSKRGGEVGLASTSATHGVTA
jgi:hypothetical protein